MQYVANIEIDVPGFETVCEFVLELEAEFDHDMSETIVSQWSIVSINGVHIRNVPVEVFQAVKAELDDYTIETALIEDYLS
jgi:hypothetical protein